MSQAALANRRKLYLFGSPRVAGHMPNPEDGSDYFKLLEAGLQSFEFEGLWEADSNVLPTSTTAGQTWVVSEPGEMDGQQFLKGDRIVSVVDNASTTTLDRNWIRIPAVQDIMVDGVDSGDGTVNAIEIETPQEISETGGQLITFIAHDTNTESPVTVQFNNGETYNIKTSSGNDVSSGGITAGTPVTGRIIGAEFVLLSDLATAAIQSSIESSLAVINGVVPSLRDGWSFSTISDITAATIPTTITQIRTNGYAVAGDHGAARYKRSASEPSHLAKFQSADGQWWTLAESHPKAAHFGVAGNANYLDGTGGNDDTEALNSFFSYLYSPPYLSGELQGHSGNQFRVTAPLELWPNSVVKATGANAFIWAKHTGEVIKPYRSRPEYYSSTGADPNGGPDGTPGGIVANTAQRSDGVTIENIQIDGGGTAATGISGENASEWRLRNIYVRNCTRGVYLYNSVDPDDALDAANYWKMYGVNVSNCAVGYQFDMNCNSNSLMNCRTNQCTESIRNYGNHNSAIHCEFEGGTTGITMRNATLPWAAGSYATYHFILEGGNTYRCAIAHTTTTFAADLAAGKWILIGSGGYFSYTFISAFNRFESIDTAHYSYAKTSQPILIGNYYQHVTSIHYMPLNLGTGNQPQLFGTEGLQFGPSGTRYAELVEVSIDVDFGSVPANSTKDVNVSAALTSACAYEAEDWLNVMVVGLPPNIMASYEPNYVRVLNAGSAATTLGVKAVRVQVWRRD